MDILAAVTEAFTARSRAILGDNLAGVYLHGSAVMGCFNEKKSDIDLLTVVNGGVPDGVKRAYMDMVVGLNALAPQKGIEMSVVKRDVCKPFVYPTPFELHFSNGHLAWYEKDPADYIAKMNGVDWDLAAHFTVLRARGKRLFGEEIEDVFGEVEREYYIDSIWRDIEGAEEDIAEDPTYIALNLCRVLAYVRDGLVLSKREGGDWGAENLPEKYRGLIRRALEDYSSESSVEWEDGSAREFAAYMLARIREGIEG
ncbi:MAG: DUF4111 domain-containing protein [Clostridia bacterium]|nr:DUF4111 domain-containing protein [Clostridia bacterium]